MATTRIMSLHINQEKTAGRCLKERLDYIKNPDKTDGGTLISSYACSPETADKEFLLMRDQYIANTGRIIQNEVIAYHIRQAFKPGEVTPEEANQIGKELAARISGSNNAYVVATHIDRHHVHNHIIMCSTMLDCTRKHRDVKRSGKDIIEMSDQLCREHGLSVITNPQDKTVTYDKWLGNDKEISSRDYLRMAIDTALRMQPDGFDALMQFLEDAGCWIKRGAHISIKPPNGERYIRLDSVGSEYTEAALRQALAGKRVHIPKIPLGDYTDKQIKCLVNIEAKLRQGKGRGFEIWAQRNNIDAKAQSIIYLKENHIGSIEALTTQIQELRSTRNALNVQIQAAQTRMKEINTLRKAIRDYRRTKDIYTQYRESGWSARFYNEHRTEIEAHKKAQDVYSTYDGKVPTLKELSEEYDNLKSQKGADTAAVSVLKSKLTTLNHIKYNFDTLERDHFPEDQQQRHTERNAR